jgi:hypothetical protein
MGSSILASLSEAGGNDPRGLVSKPLPSHSLNPADRVERNPRNQVMQAEGPNGLRPAALKCAESTAFSGRGAARDITRECQYGNPCPTPESVPTRADFAGSRRDSGAAPDYMSNLRHFP